jgi:hypothetical protein
MEFDMDLCEHAYYKPEEKYIPRLYCKLEDKVCIYTKKCLKLDRFVPLEGEKWRECYKYIMDKRKNIPKGSYFVQVTKPNKNGKLYLYVLTEEDKIERILSNFDKLEQDYVYLRKTAMGGYQVGLEPFVITQSEVQPKEEEIEEVKVQTKEVEVEHKETDTKPKKRTYNKKKKNET